MKLILCELANRNKYFLKITKVTRFAFIVYQHKSRRRQARGKFTPAANLRTVTQKFELILITFRMT